MEDNLCCGHGDCGCGGVTTTEMGDAQLDCFDDQDETSNSFPAVPVSVIVSVE